MIIMTFASGTVHLNAKCGQSASWSAWAAAIGAGKRIMSSGALSAGPNSVASFVAPGSLPAAWAAEIARNDPDYVVWSYSTPIAWHVPSTGNARNFRPGRWVVPEVHYSRTTSSHQSKILVAVTEVSRLSGEAVVRTI